MTTGNDYLCFESVIARRLTVDDMPGSTTRPFHEFIANIRAADQPLNVLLIGVDSDETIPGAEAEIGEIETRLHRICDSIALPHSIETLSGAAATYDEVRDRLAGGTVHILHYAGHGTFSRILPEESGIVLDGGALARTLTAGELKQLLAGSGVQLVFLSCCVGARTAQHLGRGDFHGTMEAVARAGVPAAVGYRWIVFDDPARAFASKFYEELMTTFSPGIAMLRARIDAASDRLHGRNNSTWASPILISQVSP
jgi:CHAT domain-containing protein